MSGQRTRIKICGLTREQDVDAAVEAGADAIGFVLYPRSPRYVSAARAAELARRLPPFDQRELAALAAVHIATDLLCVLQNQKLGKVGWVRLPWGAFATPY